MIAKNKRKIHEINAGSMADIAFLLLIFFLVTTTMEIDEGLYKNMPLKVDITETPPVIKRNVLEISLNSNDELLVEGAIIPQEELEAEIIHFYTANIKRETDVDMPKFEQISLLQCNEQITILNDRLKVDPSNVYNKEQLNKWETRRSICEASPTRSFEEMDRMAVVQLSNQSGTSYKMYLHVINTIRKVVNEQRQAKCKEIWDKDYFALNSNDPVDKAILDKLSIMVPERVMERKIDK